ncbi:MAG: ketopantoate reductase family protein [Smithellaceae bacterium]
MRIAIIGIGGVGGYFGGKLAKAYAGSAQHEIIFIARGENLKSIQQNGLQLFTCEGDYVAWPNIATDDPSVAGMFDLVFFCVKSYSLESSAGSLKSNISSNTVVIPLQNGVDSAERLRTVLPEANVISCSVYIITHVENPGIIHQEDGACKLIFGTDDQESAHKYSYILDILLQAKINAVLTDAISQALWKKYLLMCPLASLTSATGKTYGEILEDSTLKKKARDMMLEVAAVAKARHINLPENAVDKTMEMIARFGYHSKTSMQLDREKGKPTEIDTLTAYLCRAGREWGIPTPVHDEILSQLLA